MFGKAVVWRRFMLRALLLLLVLAGLLFVQAGFRVVTVLAHDEPCAAPPSEDEGNGEFIEFNDLVLGLGVALAHDCDDEEPDPETCDYGRDPEELWAANPDGHPFERAFCDGDGVSDDVKHDLDTPENAGKYCDEVAECWAYGLSLDDHH